MQTYCQIFAAAKDEVDVLIHGDIGESWWGESVSAKSVAKQLRGIAASTKQINIRVNSFGGSVADGLAIYNALRDHKARKVTIIDGVAISAGSLIAMAGDEIRAPKTALMMIHGPWTVAQGNAAEMRQHAEVLDKWADAMVSAYTRKTGKSEDEIRTMLKDGTDHWYTAEEALEAGFVDALIEEDVSASAKACLERAPAGLRTQAMAAFASFRSFKTYSKDQVMDENQVSETEPTVTETPAEAVPEPEAKVDPVPVTEPTPEPEAKGDPAAAIAAARAALEAEFNAKLAAVEAEKAAAQARLAAEIEAREIRDLTAEVSAAYSNVPMVVADFAPAIRALRKADPKASEVIETALKRVNALLDQTLDPRGSTKAETLTPEQEVDRLARAKMAEDRTLTIEQARSKVYTENPKLTAAVRGDEV
jgi:ATP-dependent Clp endopeptidase proteolytic subunit ClpP